MDIRKKIYDDDYVPSMDELKNYPDLCNSIIIGRFVKIDYRYIYLYTGDSTSVFVSAVKNGFNPSIDYLNNHPFLKKDEYFIKTLYQNHSACLSQFEGIDKSFMLLTCIKSGYVPTDDEFQFLLGNQFDDYDIHTEKERLLFDNYFMTKMIKQNPRNILYYKGSYPSVYNFALDLGFIPNVDDLKDMPKEILSCKDLMKRLINNNPQFYEIFLKTNQANDQELCKLALKNGLQLTREVFRRNLFSGFCYNDIIMEEAIRREPRNILYYFGFNEELFKLAFKLGFVPTEEDLDEAVEYRLPLLKLDYVFHQFVGINPRFVVYFLSANEKVCKDALEHGYHVNEKDYLEHKILQESEVLFEDFRHNNEQFNTNPFLKWFFSFDYDYTFLMNYQKFSQIKNFISLEDIYQIYSYPEISRLCRYFILDEGNSILPSKFIEIIKNNHLIILDRFIKIMGNVTFCNKEYILLLRKIIMKFDKYYELILDVLKKWPIGEHNKSLLMRFLESEGPLSSSITSLDELQKYYQTKLDNIKDTFIKINHQDDADDIKNIIYQIVCGINYQDFFRLNFSPYDLSELRDSINDVNLKEELSCYIALIKFLEQFEDLSLYQLLDKLITIIDNIEDSDAIATIYSIIGNFVSRIKEISAMEIKDNLTKFDTLEYGIYEDLGYKKIKNRFKASDEIVYGEDIFNRRVDYIELCGLDYVSLVHVMNAFGAGGTLKDYKHPRLVGKSYICLSGISNENTFHADDNEYHINRNVNNVLLLFDNFELDQFIMEANSDLYTEGERNSLFVDFEGCSSFLPIKRLITSSTNYEASEITLYRESDSGKYIYPKAVFMREETPTQEEINAAAYLGVPLVYVNIDAYISKRKKSKIDKVAFLPKKEEYYVLKEKIDKLLQDKETIKTYKIG